MTQHIEAESFVTMEVAAHGEVAFYAGALDDVTGSSTSAGETTLRLFQKGSRLTRQVIAQLELAADRLLTRNQHAHNRRLIETHWNADTHGELFFLLERQHVRAVPPTAYRDVLRALGELHQGSFPASASAPPGLVVEFIRGASRTPLDQAWDDLRETLDVSLSGFTGGVTVTVPEPVVTIQDSPAEARRKALLALEWPTSAEAARKFGATARNTGQWAKDRRDAGQLLGVWDSSKRTFRHPDFQFDENGVPLPQVQALLTALAINPSWTAEADANGWRRAYWLYQPFRSLSRRAMRFATDHPAGSGSSLNDAPDGAAAMIDDWQTIGPEDKLPRTPADVFAEAPDAVVRFALQHAGDTLGVEPSLEGGA